MFDVFVKYFTYIHTCTIIREYTYLLIDNITVKKIVIRIFYNNYNIDKERVWFHRNHSPVVFIYDLK